MFGFIRPQSSTGPHHPPTSSFTHAPLHRVLTWFICSSRHQMSWFLFWLRSMAVFVYLQGAASPPLNSCVLSPSCIFAVNFRVSQTLEHSPVSRLQGSWRSTRKADENRLKQRRFSLVLFWTTPFQQAPLMTQQQHVSRLRLRINLSEFLF